MHGPLCEDQKVKDLKYVPEFTLSSMSKIKG